VQTGVVIIDECIADADDLVDSYAGAKYVVPLTNPPRSVKRCSATITIYYLHMRRSWTVSPEIKTAYDDAIEWLRDVRTGKAEINSAARPQAASSGKTSHAYVNTEDYTKTKMKSFI